MSSYLEFNHVALRIPQQGPVERRFTLKNDSTHDDIYLLCIEGGDSRCFDGGSRVARNWHIATFGNYFDTLRGIIHLAGERVLGGMACLGPRGRGWTKPEDYIALYRRLLDEAVPVAEAPFSARFRNCVENVVIDVDTRKAADLASVCDIANRSDRKACELALNLAQILDRDTEALLERLASERKKCEAA